MDTIGTFYLGRRVQPNEEVAVDAPLHYDARDLTTHAVCVGMTGCGKTGLGIALVEEAVLDGIPTIVVDPKGDMANLLLAFPDLQANDFSPWLDVEGARRRDIELDQYAQEVAQEWRSGLARWGIDSTRIERYRNRAEFCIYTPGSDAGRMVNIVQSLHVPALDWAYEAETLREIISSTVSAILALVGIESDPVVGREHILLATIVERSWRAGQDMDLAQLIVQVQKPPFDRLGVLSLEVSYPESDRLSLALALNGLLASPRFAAWMEGDPLSVDALLHAPDGRPRVSIISLSHLQDAERFFFVTLLLEHVRSWLRLQQGTPNLRAMLYFDELYGFMPPHPANPPTKPLLLSLLKQARSQGMGLVLATQNPVDLDYKGLSNAGTWFVGKLQTANDRQRVLEGLIGAAMEAGAVPDRATLDKLIARLGTRTFLLHNVHEDGSVLFRTRHTMSYLRGPLTRPQIRQLTGRPVPAAPVPDPVVAPEPEVLPEFLRQSEPPAMAAREVLPEPEEELVPEPEPVAAKSRFATVPPVLPAGIREYYLPVKVPIEWAVRAAENDGQVIIYQHKELVYRAALHGHAQVRIESARYGISQKLSVSRVAAVPEDEPFVSWDEDPLIVDVNELDTHPAQDARYAPLPALLGNAKRLQSAERDFEEYVYRETALKLSSHPVLKLSARADESPSQFRRRCYDQIARRRDEELHKVEKSYQTKVERLEARIRREERELEQDEAEYEARKREEMISAGESVLNMLSRRRQSRMLSTASRKRRLTQQAQAEIQESWDAIDDLEGQIDVLLTDLEQERAEIQEKWSQAADGIQEVRLRPRKADIYVQDWGVVWLPYWDITYQDRGLEQRASLPAFEV